MPGQARHSWRFSPAQSGCRFRRFGVLIHESHEAHCERSCLSRSAVGSDRASAAALRIAFKSTEPDADARSGRWGGGLAESPTLLQADCATGIRVDPIEPVMKFLAGGDALGLAEKKEVPQSCRECETGTKLYATAREPGTPDGTILSADETRGRCSVFKVRSANLSRPLAPSSDAPGANRAIRQPKLQLRLCATLTGMLQASSPHG